MGSLIVINSIQSRAQSPNLDCLARYGPYAQLIERQRFTQRWHRLVALLPFAAVSFVAIVIYPKSRETLTITILFFSSLIWALLVIGYTLWLFLRWASFRCPHCNSFLGRDSECNRCGFPRNLPGVPST